MNCITNTIPTVSQTSFMFVRKTDWKWFVAEYSRTCSGICSRIHHWRYSFANIVFASVYAALHQYHKYALFYYTLLFYFHLLTQFNQLTKENCRENKTKNLKISTETEFEEFQLTGCWKLDDINWVSSVLNLFDHKIQPKR